MIAKSVKELQSVDLPPTRVLSLFTGAGGLELSARIVLPSAFTVCYVETEVTVTRILEARIAEGTLDDAPIWSDVRTFSGSKWNGAVDLILGGFPCTDLSVAGRRAGIAEGTRSGLWFEYLRIIREVQPRWVFIENVPPVLKYPAGHIVLGGLAEAGFDVEWMSLRASDVGAPHRRERVFIMAYASRDERAGSHGEDWRGRGVRATGYTLAHSPLRGLGVRGEPPGGGGPAGEGDVEYTEVAGRKVSGGTSGDESGLPRPECPSSSRLPLFPPGPNDAAAWRAILAQWPWLAPAVESGVRGDVDGTSVVVDAARADQLRAIGNSVCPLQAAVAFTILARRAGRETNSPPSPQTSESLSEPSALLRTATGNMAFDEWKQKVRSRLRSLLAGQGWTSGGGQMSNWATPQARDEKSPDQPESGNFKRKVAAGFTIDLNSQAAMWTTPQPISPVQQMAVKKKRSRAKKETN